MLENNGHYLCAKMMAEQQATEIVQLQEALNVQAKENDNLKVQNKTLKYVPPFSCFIHIYMLFTMPSDTIAMFANESHKGGHETGRILSSIRAGLLPDKPAP